MWQGDGAVGVSVRGCEMRSERRGREGTGGMERGLV